MPAALWPYPDPTRFAPTDRVPLPVTLLVLAVATAPVTVRRRWPLPALLVMVPTTFPFTMLPMPASSVGAAAGSVVVLYTLGLRSRTPALVVGCGVTLVVTFLPPVQYGRLPTQIPVWEFLLLVGVTLACAGVGRLVRARRARAVRRAAEQAARARAELMLAVARERERIAGELHAAIAHVVAGIVVSAGAGGRDAGDDPAQARQVLHHAATSGGDALAAMRRLLGILRSQGETPALATPSPGVSPPRHRRNVIVDYVISTAVAAWAVLVASWIPAWVTAEPELLSTYGLRGPTGQAYLPVTTAVMACAALVTGLRRRIPRTTVFLGAVLLTALPYLDLLVDLSSSTYFYAALLLFLAIGGAAARLPYRTSLLLAVAVPWLVLCVGGLPLDWAQGSSPVDVLLINVWVLVQFVVCWAVGWAVGALGRRRRRRRAAEVAEARAREQQVVVAAERSRLARELHDGVAHHLSAVVLTARAALHAGHLTGPQAHEALDVVRSAGVRGLESIRRLVGVLAIPVDPSPEPPAGLAGLDLLIAENAAAGLPVLLAEHGDRPRLPADVDLSAYRIIQEALTNARKHGGGPASLTLSYSGKQVHITVQDPGHRGSRPAAPIGGHGLLGVRERVAMLGGRLTVGPQVSGGWQLDATLPVPAG